MMAPIDAVVVSYHTGPSLWRCLASLDGLARLGVVRLVDNGNPPAVTAALRRWAAQAPERRCLIEPHANLGFAAACNLAMAEASSELALFLNPDAAIDDDALNAMVEARAELGEPALVGATIVNDEGVVQSASCRGELTWPVLISEVLRLPHVLPGAPRFHLEMPDAAPPVAVPTVSGAGFLMDTRLYREIGGMDERYFLHFEDVDLCRSVRQTGAKVVSTPTACIYHQGGSSAAPAKVVANFKRKSLVAFMSKWYPGVRSHLLRAIMKLTFRNQ